MLMEHRIGASLFCTADERNAHVHHRHESAPAKKLRPAGKGRRWPMRCAFASAVLMAGAGCAVLDPQTAKAWEVEPLLSVKHAMESSQAYYTMGRYHDGSQAWDKSIKAYRKAIMVDPRHIEAYNALGVALARSGRVTEAETTLRQAVAIDPSRTHVRSNLGYTLLLAGKIQDAVIELEATVAQDRSNSTAVANLRSALAQFEASQRDDPALERATASNDAPYANHQAAGSAANAKPSAAGVAVARGPTAPQNINVAAPITYAVVARPLPVAVDLPASRPPELTAGIEPPIAELASPPRAKPRAVTIDQLPALAAVASAALAMRTIDEPTVGSLEERPRPAEVQAEVRADPVDAGPPAPAAIAAAIISRLEVSNGNGISGMAARVGHWLASQGMDTALLTNQRPYDQKETIIQYRVGHEDAARRVARVLPAPAQAASSPMSGLHSDVRVVLGRDWVTEAVCLKDEDCRPVWVERALTRADKIATVAAKSGR
ncbi:MAG: LytR C-terminal domain-containing protein [Rhizobacter sp.]|nr:LytR C-terminal domain-containing protein [Rhizobacter sp.]